MEMYNLTMEKENEVTIKEIDLMTSDDEDEEVIELENKEDCAFLDDETEEQEEISFYRRLPVELDQNRRQKLWQRRNC